MVKNKKRGEQQKQDTRSREQHYFRGDYVCRQIPSICLYHEKTNYHRNSSHFAVEENINKIFYQRLGFCSKNIVVLGNFS